MNNKLYLEPGVGPEYVRLTYTPFGEKPKSVWAIKIKTTKGGKFDNEGVLAFWRVGNDGDKPEPPELILTTEKEAIMKPARMNLFYGRLERNRDVK